MQQSKLGLDFLNYLDGMFAILILDMNKKKITNVCVYSEENKKETIGILHIHDLIKIFK